MDRSAHLQLDPAVAVAANPVSWGVFEKTEGDPLLPGPELVLDQVQAAGYAGVELGPPGFFGDGPTVRARLAARRLSLVGAFLPLRFSRAECAADDRAWMAGVLDLLAEAMPDGVRPKAILADASVEPERMRWAGQIVEHPEAAIPPERLSVLLDNLHRAGELARSRGFDAVLHFHAGSYVETFDEIRRVMDRVDPALVGMCLDTGHARFGGADPTDLLREYRSMVRHVHVKDCDLGVLDEVRRSGGGLTEAWRRGVFCELGTGTGDLAGFLTALRASAYEGWLVVEQDRFLTPADTPDALLALQARNRAWLRAQGY
ncbi:MAG: TIM barrel protein [Chloroflexota bacterium]